MRKQVVFCLVLTSLCVGLAGCGEGGGTVEKSGPVPPLQAAPQDKGKAPVKIERDTN